MAAALPAGWSIFDHALSGGEALPWWSMPTQFLLLAWWIAAAANAVPWRVWQKTWDIGPAGNGICGG